MTKDSDAKDRSVKPLYLTAIAAGLLQYACFFPLNFGFLGWIALVPLLFLVHSTARPRHIYLAAFVGGLAFYIPALQWMRVAHPAMYATWIFLAIYCALYFPLGIALLRRMPRVPSLIAVPVVWVGLDYLRMHFPTGFSWLPESVHHDIGFGWYYLGYTQHDWLAMIQISDLFGVYGVTFVVVLVNTAIFLLLQEWLEIRAIPVRQIRGAIFAATVLAGSLVYGYVRLDHAAFEPGPRVALLQCDVAQAVKIEHGDNLTKHMIGLFRRAVEVSADERPDLVVWPETTFENDWYFVAPGVDRTTTTEKWQEAMLLGERFAWQMAGNNTSSLLGLNGLEWDGSGTIWKYNTALLLNRDGTVGPRYDKHHLVPMGEYVPLRNTFPWMRNFTPYTHEYSCKPGEVWTRFPLQADDRKFTFGVIICYEDSDPRLARHYVQKQEGASVDFLVNISNDGWFNGTEEHEQHLAICRFRAVECRRSIVRAVNMGISGIIDADGRIVKIPNDDWSKSKKVATVVNGIVPIDHRESIYADYVRDGLPLVCWLMMLVGLWRGKPR